MDHSCFNARSWILAGLIASAGGGSKAPAETVTLTFSTDPGGWGDVFKLTFDTKRIPESEIKTLVLISPHFAGQTAISRNLELCEQPHPQYFPCGSGDLHYAHFFDNARVNLDIATKQLAYLETLKYPKELKPVVQYEKKSLSFSRWLEQTRYEFYKSWDTRVLKRKYQGLDLSVLCSSQIGQIELAGSKDEKFELAKNEWRNCVLNASFKLFGSYPGGGYPMDAWKRFLKAYGIKEQLIKQVVD